MKTSGEFLIFLLLLITNARVFFVESRKDAIVVLSPLAFFLSVFQIFSWGFDVFTGLAFILSVLVLFSNFHAIYRYFERLYVDHYSPLMYIWAISTTLFCIACLGFLIYFAPSTPLTKRHVNDAVKNVNLHSERYTGNFRVGFEKSGLFDKTNMNLHFFETVDEDSSQKKPVVIFFPDKRSETYNYIPFLLQLTEGGWTVISSDFSTKDSRWLHNFFDGRIFRRFGMVCASITDNYKFNSQKEFYTYNSSLECDAVFKTLENRFPEDTKFILVSDFMANTAISDFKKLYPEKIAGLIYLDEMPEYKTPGYGFIAQTDPLLITILGQPRDKNGTDTKLAADAFLKRLSDIQNQNQIEENNDAE